MKLKTTAAFIAATLLIFTGCVKNKPKVQEKRNHYNKAYSHGCSSKNSIYKKNVKRYVKDDSYRNGWNDGYYHCGEKKDIYTFDKSAYDDGYKSALYKKPIIKYRHDSYRYSWKKGYDNYYKNN